MSSPVKKIALIGPESSGKSTLCMELARHFNTAWVPEFAREYVASLKSRYTLADIEFCAHEQLRSEEEQLMKAHRFLFCDSELIIAKVWCADVFKSVPAWIEEKIDSHPYDLFLLTQPDIPFKKDDVRENPHRRDYFFDWYRRELENKKFSYEIIGGQGALRFSNSLAAIQKHFPNL